MVLGNGIEPFSGLRKTGRQSHRRNRTYYPFRGEHKLAALGGIEPPSPDRQSGVIYHYTIEPEIVFE